MEASVAGLIALTTWFALALQLWLIIDLSQYWVTAVTRFFGYFTILTNVLVAVTLSVPLLRLPASAWFASSGVRSAIAVCIAMVGVVYTLVLQALWNPQGAQALADLLLHKVVPAAYLLFWMAFVDKRSLQWRAIPRWLIYPLGYLAIAVSRGLATGWYPYPFIDASELGFARVLVNSIALIAVFAAFGAILIGGGRLLARR